MKLFYIIYIIYKMMSLFKKNIQFLFGKAFIQTSNNTNYIVNKQLRYNKNSPFLYQFGRYNTIEDYNEEFNTYTLNTQNELPLNQTTFICNKNVDDNKINYYIKNNSHVNYLYIKVFSKELMLIKAV